jgi:hypothetical protein
MVLLLALCLLADGGVPPPGGVELTTYRSERELPREWVKLLPKGFDFRTELLATSARPGAPVALVQVARVERFGAEAYVWATPRRAERRPCPPCRGIQTIELPPAIDLGPVVRPSPLYRLTRVPGRVLEVAALEPAIAVPECPVCTAP